MTKIIDLIGNTPLVDLSQLSPKQSVKIFGKLEGQNPAGSVKDRPAYYMIKGALERGELRAGDKLIEATSGNTGIALAMIAQQMGIEIELVLPKDSTVERVQTMRAFGAKVILTQADSGIEGSIQYVREKVAGGGYVLLNQFGNPDNPRAHYETTGPEIWDDTNGQITHFVSAMGTTGTIMGVSRFLKEKNKSVRIIGVQPDDKSNIPGIRKWPQEYLPTIYDHSRVDDLIYVSEKNSADMARSLAKTAGVFAGMSSGGAVFAAIKLAETLNAGIIVCIICDRGDRYLSSNLFDA
jgi:S-sulfo-L-cysteine synthase (O-acetyl-L-serine-dependent)